MTDPRSNPPAASSRASRWLVCILVSAVAIRLLAWFVTAPTGLVNDELSYFDLGARLARGDELGDLDGRPPGVVFFYAGLLRVAGFSIDVARAGNVALSVVSVYLVFWIGCRLGGSRIGLGAALLACLYPGLIGFSHSLWSETLYIFLELLAIVLLLMHRERRSAWLLLLAGMLLGLGALTREVGVVVAVILAGYVALQALPDLKKCVARASILLSGCVAVVLPWSLHLHATTGQVALSSGTTWLNLYVGNAPLIQRGRETITPWSYYPTLGETRSEREAAARRLALRAIADRMPWWPVEKLTVLRDLTDPTSFVVRRLAAPVDRKSHWRAVGAWEYRFRFEALESLGARRSAVFLCIAMYLLVVLPGVGGLVLAPNRAVARLLALFVLAHVLPTLATFAFSRFRLPVMPVLTVTAASTFLAFPESWRSASTRRRWAAGLTVLVVLGLILSNFGAVPI